MADYRGFVGQRWIRPGKEAAKEAADKVEERQFHAAHRAFDSHNKLISDSVSMVASFANNAMRAPPIAAAAGVAGVLGFFSANKAALVGTAGITFFNQSLYYLCGSIAFAVIAPAASYLSQTFFTHSLGSHTFHYSHPFIRASLPSKVHFWAGLVFQIAAIALVLASVGCLGAGGWHFVQLAQFLSHRS